jgi:tripeptidyl-peptidase II
MYTFSLTFVDCSYTVGPNPAKKVPLEAKPAEPTVKPTTEEKMEDIVRDVKIEYLGKLSHVENGASFDELWKKLLMEYPDYLPLYVTKLKHLDAHSKRLDHLTDIISAAKAVISHVSEKDLAQILCRHVDLENGDSVQVCTLFGTFLKSRLNLSNYPCE